MDTPDDLDEFDDKLILESTADQWRAKAVLTELQWLIFNELKTRIEIDDEQLILAGCALSAFFDPTIVNAAHTKDVRRMSALFAIVRGQNRVKTRPLLFVADDECDASGGTEFLELWGAPLLRFDQCDSVIVFVEKVMSRLHNTPCYTGNRQPINKLESNVASHIRTAIKHVCLHEVAVLRMIPEMESSPRQLDALRSLGPVDLLIHSEDPNAPLLCIEVDGPTHLEERSQRKDQYKTMLLRSIGMPVLRVLPGDISVWNNPRSNEFQLYSSILLSWVRRLATGMRDLGYEDAEDHQHQQHRLRIRNQLARTIFDSDYYDLAEEKRSKIDANELLTDLDVDKHWSDIVRAGPPSLTNSWDTDNQLVPPSRLAKYVKRVQVRGTISSGILAEAVFKVGGASEILQSSTFFLSHPYLDDSELYKQISMLALRHVYWQADRRLKGKSR